MVARSQETYLAEVTGNEPLNTGLSSTSPRLPFRLISGGSPLNPALETAGRLEGLEVLVRRMMSELELLRRDNAEVVRLMRAVVQPDRAKGHDDHALGPQTGIRFRLFGNFRVEYEGAPVEHWSSRKGRLLLASLAAESPRPIPKDVLIDRFWPECSPARGSNNLSIAIYQVRAAFKELASIEAQVISVQQSLYSLDATTSVWIDVNEFRKEISLAWAAVRGQDRKTARSHLFGAIDLYDGQFMECDPYEEWIESLRRTYENEYTRALSWLAGDSADAGDWTEVAQFARRIVTLDPCDEQGHRWLIWAHASLGNRAEALLQYRECASRLRAELGVGPSEETRRLVKTIMGT